MQDLSGNTHTHLYQYKCQHQLKNSRDLYINEATYSSQLSPHSPPFPLFILHVPPPESYPDGVKDGRTIKKMDDLGGDHLDSGIHGDQL